MSSPDLRNFCMRVEAAIDAHDEDWILVDEIGNLCISALPGQMIEIRQDQVQNSAGGFVFAVSDLTRIRRFLILGTSGGTYYSSEKQLTMENVKALKDIIHRGKASLILDEIKEISLAGRNPRQDPIMLALALCARYRVDDLAAVPKAKTDQLYIAYIKQMHKDAMALVNEVCRIPTHLFSFVKYCEMVAGGIVVNKEEEEERHRKKIEAKRAKKEGQEVAVVEVVQPPKPKSTGWGRLMRKIIEKWYTSKSTDLLAMHMTKYGKREGWSHRDLFRLAHPKVPAGSDNQLVYEQLFHYAVKGNVNPRKRRLAVDSEEAVAAKTKYTEEQMKTEEESKGLGLVEKFISLNKDTPEEEVVEAIKTHGLVREHIPTEHLNSPLVWKALLEKMPMTAMIRNLAKMQTLNILQGEYLMKVVNQITDEGMLKKARVHPIQLLLAKTIYDEGKGDKGKLEWKPNTEVSVALERAFYASFVNVPPTNKRFCLAFDISGSMTCRIMNTCLSARQASAAIGLNLLKVEKNVECVGFCDDLSELPYNGNWTLERVSAHMDTLRMGMTDCSLPMQWARKNKKKFDVFIVFTDNETYHGEEHPYVALQKYRKEMGIDARLIVAGMTATEFTIADPEDAGMLDVVGFDSAVPELIHNFVEGKI